MTPRELLGALRERWTDLQGSVDGAEDGPGWMAGAAELVGWMQGRLEAMAGPDFVRAADSCAHRAATPGCPTCGGAFAAQVHRAVAGPERAPEPDHSPDVGKMVAPEPAAIDRSSLSRSCSSKPVDIGCGWAVSPWLPGFDNGRFGLKMGGTETLIDRDAIARLAAFAGVAASEPSSVSPGRLRARCAELEREREDLRTRLDEVPLGAAELRAERNAARTRARDAERERDAALRRIADLRGALHRTAGCAPRVDASLVVAAAREALDLDDVAAQQQNTSGRHEPGAVEGPSA